MRAVNLIPAEQRSGTRIGAGRSGGAAYAVLALVAGLALLAFLYGRAEHQIASRRAQAQALNAQAQRAQAQAGQLAPYTSFASLRAQRMQAVDTLVASRFDWAHAFHEFGRVLPAYVSVSSLSGAIGSAASAGSGAQAAARSAAAPAAGASGAAGSSTPAGGSNGAAAAKVASVTPPGSVPQFAISGCAISQRVVALTLARLRLIDGVQTVTLQSSTASSPGSGAVSASGGAGGSCPAGDPQFSAQVTFAPLPAAAAGQAPSPGAPATATTSSTGSGR